LPETKRFDAPIQARTKRFSRGWLSVYVVVGFLTMLPFAGFEATFAIFGKARFALDEASTAAVFLFIGLLTAAVHGGLIGPLTARFGSARLLRIGLACIACGLLTMSSAVVWPVLLIALALMVVGSGLSTPSLTTLVVNSADDARRGEVLGVQQSANAFARTIGPPVAGLAFDVIGVGAPFALGAIVAVFALLTVVTRIHVD
jgi:MFS family permease